ncbi:MAG: single- stranded DNA-binding family protein [Candidatus Njordarchaeia archaeon]
MRMSTGFVRASAYDGKVRRVLFAITKDVGVADHEVLKAAAEINKKIFEELQNRGVNKRDVIRISCEFDVVDGKINWLWDTLKIEVYRESEEIGSKMSAFLAQIEEEEIVLQDALVKLKNLAERIRSIVDDIERTIEELKRKRESVSSELK